MTTANIESARTSLSEILEDKAEQVDATHVRRIEVGISQRGTSWPTVYVRPNVDAVANMTLTQRQVDDLAGVNGLETLPVINHGKVRLYHSGCGVDGYADAEIVCCGAGDYLIQLVD